MAKQLKSDAAFIEKIKTLNISTGAKPPQPKCKFHGLAIHIPIRVVKAQARPSCEERSFAA